MDYKLSGITFEYGVKGAEISSMKVGGEIYRLCIPETVLQLRSVVEVLSEKGEEYIVLGNGSNVMFTDKGYSGTVILTTKLKNIVPTETGYIVDAGVMLTALSQRAAKDGFGGLEFAYGIPGTVGGAIYMNAGAYGGEIKDVVSRIFCIQKDRRIELSAAEAEFAYRHSVFCNKELYITGAEFVLPRKDSAEVFAKMEENLGKRKAKQPLEYPSCGSTFKRPAGHFAGALIEQSGLRGYSIGGAQVSEKHCGFIINRGGATARDVTELIDYVRNTVYKKTGVTLETEVEIY